jgi:hypothetical protein
VIDTTPPPPPMRKLALQTFNSVPPTLLRSHSPPPMRKPILQTHSSAPLMLPRSHPTSRSKQQTDVIPSCSSEHRRLADRKSKGKKERPMTDKKSSQNRDR